MHIRIILSLLFLCAVFAEVPAAKSKSIRVLDIGVLGLASHDLFAWKRDHGVSIENGRLDLSTIFDADEEGNLNFGQDWFEQKVWVTGGNKKNSENAPVYTVTMGLVDIFENFIQNEGLSPSEARLKTVEGFHALVKDSYERLLGMDFPTSGTVGDVTNQEQAALRVLHDILPGKITLYRDGKEKEFIVTNPETTKTKLNEGELFQEIRYFDGVYDKEYYAIKTGAPKFAVWMGAPSEVNLFALDDEFVKTYGEYFTLESCLNELGQLDAAQCSVNSLEFSRHYEELFSKAICNQQQGQSEETNYWIPRHIECN